jgi:hypothetical protein
MFETIFMWAIILGAFYGAYRLIKVARKRHKKEHGTLPRSGGIEQER